MDVVVKTVLLVRVGNKRASANELRQRLRMISRRRRDRDIAQRSPPRAGSFLAHCIPSMFVAERASAFIPIFANLARRGVCESNLPFAPSGGWGLVVLVAFVFRVWYSRLLVVLLAALVSSLPLPLRNPIFLVAIVRSIVARIGQFHHVVLVVLVEARDKFYLRESLLLHARLHSCGFRALVLSAICADSFSTGWELHLSEGRRGAVDDARGRRLRAAGARSGRHFGDCFYAL